MEKEVTNKLYSKRTLQECEQKAVAFAKEGYDLYAELFTHLADTMRENERLANSLEEAIRILQGDTPLEKIVITSQALEQYRNKDSVDATKTSVVKDE